MITRRVLLMGLSLLLLAVLAGGLVQAQQPVPSGTAPGGPPAGSAPSAALGTGFTYQGRLNDASGNPIDDTCAFTFSLWDDASAGSQLGAASVVAGVTVADGYFAAQVNSGGEFGSYAFVGQARWLEIAVQCSGDAGPVAVSPRQPLSAAPQSHYALSTGALQGYAVDATPPQDGQTLKWFDTPYDFWAPVDSNSHDHWGQAWSGSGYGLYLSGGEIGLEGHGSSNGVRGETDGTNGSGVRGLASATSGVNYGVHGQTASPDGYGVYGRSFAGGGATAAVYGLANSLGGYGVYGEAPTYGVYGKSSSTVGQGVHGEGVRYGVYGLSAAASGTTYGIYGQADSTSGSGVYGYASAASGSTYGVQGEVDSPDGRGVRGHNSAASGSAVGVSGTTASTAGYGVYGYAAATSGTNFGVYGYSASTDGYGVYGSGASGTGTTYGVYGHSSADQGHGVHGYASDVNGYAHGVYGEAASAVGSGVYGLASASGGAGYGVYGRSNSTAGYGVYGVTQGTSGYGVYGYANNSTGTNYGVYGRTMSAAGYAGYFNGRLYAHAVINSTATPANHAARIHNTSDGTSPDVLALQVGYTGWPGEEINFITFFQGSNLAVGAVEGDGAGGVTFKSGSGDYAEFLPRRDPGEEIAPGDVVGVWDGAVSKATQGASQVLVVSDRPIVLGNDPGEGNAAGYEKVAFLGQVEVKVRGAVAAGDYLVPSGREDGSAVAVAPEAITAEQFAQVVGQAWESSDDAGVRTVRAVVGRVQHDPTAARLAGRVQELEGTVSRLEARLAALEKAAPAAAGPTSLSSSWLLPGAGVLLAGVAGGWLLRRKGGGR